MGVSRSGKKEIWHMANGNTTWVEPATERNINKIYDFLEAEYQRAAKAGKRTPEFSYSQIARKTSIDNRQVQFAIWKLSFLKNPICKITAKSYRGKTGAKTTEKVELLRLI